MNLTIEPGHPLNGEVTLPGDKSLSHRAALFGALAEGESRIENFLISGVSTAMLRGLTGLGVTWQLAGTTLTVQGRGLASWQPPAAALDCGNSATTLRLLAGALAAAGIPAVLDGSPGLRRRPMDRIVEPLLQMGVAIEPASTGGAPLVLAGRTASQGLRAIDYQLPVASAQVKTCLLLAALAADGPTRLVEPALSRDHSERMLASQGVSIQYEATSRGPGVILTPPERPLTPLRTAIPGDFSAAAFLIVAALITPGSTVVLRNVGLNPTRTGLLSVLHEMGGRIDVLNLRQASGEPVGDLQVQSSRLDGGTVSGARVVEMIDEFPVFGVAAAFAHGQTVVCDASELRYKESDRIGKLAREMQTQGIQMEERADGFRISGAGSAPGGAAVDCHGDHRLAMALAVLGLGADRPVEIHGAEIIRESFPEFSQILTGLGARIASTD